MKKTYSPLRDAIRLNTRRSSLYRRNTFYFPRIVDGADILKGADGVKLRIQRAGGSPLQFAWSWETDA
jgi:hypothetical protein